MSAHELSHPFFMNRVAIAVQQTNGERLDLFLMEDVDETRHVFAIERFFH